MAQLISNSEVSTACLFCRSNAHAPTSSAHDVKMAEGRAGGRAPSAASQERLLDVAFLEGAPEDWECPICKQNLLEPFILSCCGNHLCRACVDRLKERPCPLCSTPFTFMLDKGRQRVVEQAKVRCPNAGCGWVGELRDLLAHLEGAETGKARCPPPLCQLEPVLCGNEGCQLQLPRGEAEQHQQEECPYRRVLCQYCKSVETAERDMSAAHWPQCPDFPTPCPNACGVEEMPRSLLQAHCDRDCMLQMVRCPYYGVGCVVSRLRKSLPTHVKGSELHHAELLVGKTVEMERRQEFVVAKFAEEMKKMTAVIQERLKQQDEVIQTLKRQALEQKSQFEAFVKGTNARFLELSTEFQTRMDEKDYRLELLGKQMQENSDRVQTELQANLADQTKAAQERAAMVGLGDKERELLEQLEARLEEQIKAKPSKSDFEKVEEKLGDLVKRMDDFEEMAAREARSRKDDKELLKSAVASVERQASSMWEERLKAAMELSAAQHKAEMKERKASEEKTLHSLTEMKAGTKRLEVMISALKKGQEEVRETERKEIERVTCEFGARIDKMVAEVDYIERAATPTPPFSFTVTRFSKRRERKDTFVSDPFFTGRRGYRMVVRVDAAGTDTHVSVWCCITRGQYDDLVPWPLQADIYIRLVNPRDKDKYYERQISYDHQAQQKHAGKVVTGDKNYLWGLREFITLREVLSGHFLVGDALDFVVHRVELKEMDRPTGNRK